MARWRDFYVGVGHNPEVMEKEVWYLSLLSLDTAMDISEYLETGKCNLGDFHEFLGILEKYKLKEDREQFYPDSLGFPYQALYRGMKKDSEKELSKYRGLALEMSLMMMELKDAFSSAEKMKIARGILNDLSHEFLTATQENCPSNFLSAA